MAADEKNIDWTSRTQGSAWKVPKAGGDAVMLAEGSSQTSGIVGWGIMIAGTNVFFSSSPLVLRVPATGGSQEAIFSNVSDGRFTVHDEGRILWASSGKSVAVRVASTTATLGTEPRILASGPQGISHNFHGIAFDTDDVYWTLHSANVEQEAGVYRQRKPKDY